MAITRSLKKTGLLLWKNGLLIFRRPVSLASEILIPMNLYLAILVLRFLFPPEYFSDQLFRPMALPSAGLLPFAQTLICDLSTTSSNYSTDMPIFPDANVTKLYSLLEDNNISEIGVSFCQSLTDIQNIGTCQDPLLAKLTNPNSGQDLKFGDLLTDKESFRLFLSNDLNLNDSVIDNILNATVNTDQASGSLPLLFLQSVLGSSTGDIINNLDGTRLRILICDDPFLDNFITFSSPEARQEVIGSLCNLTDSQFNLLANELQDQLSNHCSDLLSPDNLEKIAILYEILSLLPAGINEGPSNFREVYELAHGFLCGSLPLIFPPTDLSLLASHLLYGDFYQKDRLMANLTDYPDRIAPKILYSPNNTVTRSIMDYANITFEAIQVLLDTLELVDNCSSTFVTDNPPDSDLIGQLDTYINNPLVDTLSGVSQTTLSRLQALLEDGSPNNIWNRTADLHDNIVLIEEYIYLVDWDVFYPVGSENDMINISFNKNLQKDLGISSVFAGIVFNEGIDEIPLKNVTMKIRMNSTFVHDTKLLKEPVWFEGPEGDVLWKRRYLGGGFVFLQDMVERAIIDEIIGDRVTSPGGYVHQLPYHCFKNDLFLVGIQWLLPLTMSLGWMLSVAMIVRGVVREKESRMKEVMRMMGLGRGQLWGSWMITSFLTLLISVIFITVSLKYGGFLTHTNGLLLFGYLTTYSVAVIMYCFLVSLFFTNANMAACVAALAYFLFFFLQIVVLNKLSLLPVAAVMLMCVMLPIAFALGCTIMVQFELQLVGLQFDNMFSTTFPENSFNFGMVFIMLIVDIILYGVLIWYIEAVFPGKYGVSKPWYFPVQPLIDLFKRFHGRSHLQFEDRELLIKAEDDDGPVCEDDPEGLTRGISIQGLTKTYHVGCKKQVKALQQLNLNLYEGQITAFLGHNGAGKTTTMSLLTGLYEPSKGTALIYDMNIRNDMDKIRNCLGMCPQHNVLFDDLTVEEHLMFFAQMKNMNYKDAKQQVPMWLEKVGLLTHQKIRTRHLSGGMKRKLSILLAFVGNPKTIILDEPTSGVDPYARTQIWDFISQLKDGRTIMLSTHHMDEAEVLGDRIAIISKGNLLCSGSFEFLKGRFGHGHHLTVVLDRKSRDPLSGQEDEDIDGASNTSHITDYLKQHVPDVSLVEKRGWELNYLLPLQQSRPLVLKELFKGIDSDQSDLGIQHYGMTSCSMEEIFIDLTQREFADTEDNNFVSGTAPHGEGTFPQRTLLPRGSSTSFGVIDEDSPDGNANDNDDNDEKELIKDSDDVAMVTGVRLLLYQYVALIVKRLHHTRRNPKSFFVQNVLPLFVIGGCLAIAHSVLNVYNPPNLLMHPSMFFEFTSDNYMFAAQNNTAASNNFDTTLYRPCGIGAKYTRNPNNPHSICYADTPPDSCHGYPSTLGQCDCKNCSRPSIVHGAPSCYNGTVTGTRIQNMTDYDYEELSSYLLSTKRTFVEERYGGVSFGHRRTDVPQAVDDRYNNDTNSTDPVIALQEGAKAWFSYKGFHAMPSYLNTMNNAILRANLPIDSSIEYGISTFSHPFPTTILQKLQSAIQGASFLVNPLAAMFALGFVVAGVVLLVIEERSSKFLHLQQVCGLDRLSYWLSTFSWDFTSYIFVSIAVLIMYAVAQDDNFSGVDTLFSMFLLFLSYGVSMIPWMYIYSYMFDSPRTAYVMLFCLNFFSGLLLLIVDAVVISLALDYNDNNFSYWLTIVPMPSYILARGMMYFTLDRIVEEVASSISQQDIPHPLVKLWPYILAMVLHGIIAIVLLIIIQLFHYKTTFSFRRLSNAPQLIDSEDEDVTAERRRVSEGNCANCPLLLDNLTKVYRSKTMTVGGCRDKSRTAVNQLSLGLQQAECFGLLGLNGAGKTSTFKMITGDTRCTSGDAIVNGLSVNKSVTRARKSIGYCPQFDALSDSLTGREHLVLICKLRGIPPKVIKPTVDKALSRLELDAHADKPVYSYSGGNMRRLSTAIALIADPPVLLLDEPTSGVDPRARQFLWKTIKSVVSTRHAVLLTTHNMAECETLCSRIGIMVNGELKCVGTPQELKSKFGKGYSLKLRVLMEQREETKAFIEESFPSVTLKEEHHNSLMYGLPAGLPLSAVYLAIEGARARLDIEDYSLSQTTLDDVFIHFVKEQREEGMAGRTLTEATPLDNTDIELRVAIDPTTDTSTADSTVIVIDGTIPTDTTQL